MRQLRFTVLALSLVLLGGCDMLKDGVGGYELKYQAKARVTNVLEGVKVGGTGKEMQTALCRWYNDSVYINEPSTAATASDAFDRWIIEGGLNKGITAYEIVAAAVEEGTEIPTVLVSGTINSLPFAMHVPKNTTIVWETKPKPKSRWD